MQPGELSASLHSMLEDLELVAPTPTTASVCGAPAGRQTLEPDPCCDPLERALIDHANPLWAVAALEVTRPAMRPGRQASARDASPSPWAAFAINLQCFLGCEAPVAAH